MLKKIFFVLSLLFVTQVAFAAFPTNPNNNDVFVQDGVRYKYKASTSVWEKQVHPYVVNPLEYGSALTDATIQLALTAIGALDTELVIDAPYVLSDDVTIPSNVHLVVVKGGGFSIANTKTLTINGDFDAPLGKVFTLTGTGAVAFGKVAEVYPQWWGAIGDGDDANKDTNRVAIQAAIDSLTKGDVVIIGEYSVRPATTGYTVALKAKDNVNLVGQSTTGSILKIADNAGLYRAIFGHLADGSTAQNVQVRNITFDNNALNNTFDNLPDYQGGGVSASRAAVNFHIGDNIIIEDNVFTNSDSVNTVVVNGYPLETNCKNMIIRDNQFKNQGYPLNLAYEHDHSTIYAVGRGMNITNNEFAAVSWVTSSARTAIETHGTDQQVLGNKVNQYSKGMNITGVNTVDADQIIVANNLINVFSVGIDLWGMKYGAHQSGFGLDRTNISNNVIKVDYTQSATIHLTRGISVNTSTDLDLRNVIIDNNNIDFIVESVAYNDIGTSVFGIGFNDDDASGVGCDNCIISNNLITNSPQTGIRFLENEISSLTVKNNTIVNPGTSLSAVSDPYRDGMQFFPTDVTQILNVTGNIFYDTRDTTVMPNSIQMGRYAAGTPFTGKVEVTNNKTILTGTNQAAFLRTLYVTSTDVNPLYIEEGQKVNVPTGAVRAGSRIFNTDTFVKKYVLAAGAVWNTEEYGAAAPIGGTYIVGDRVINTVPSAGGNIGWVCTTGGTPGIWKTYGAVAP